jgi:hypothetical protein
MSFLKVLQEYILVKIKYRLSFFSDFPSDWQQMERFVIPVLGTHNLLLVVKNGVSFLTEICSYT